MGYRIENQCCDCATPGYPCLGDLCKRINVKVYFCDKCNAAENPEDLFIYETKDADYDYCEDCFVEACIADATRTSEVMGND